LSAEARHLMMTSSLSLERRMVRHLAFVPIVVAASVLSGGAVAQPAGEGVYASAAQLQALTAQLKEGVITAPAPTGPGTTLLAARRDRPGEVELHSHLNDQFVVQAGHATARVGGAVAGNRQIAPGEFRGGTITGGREYQLGPGDILWIPAGAPHQVTPKGGTFRYLAFKFEAAGK
jgi:mannose-6-phosphate isomerase-like protein (cupin superfamily)